MPAKPTPRDVIVGPTLSGPWILGALMRQQRSERISQAISDLAAAFFEEYEDETHLPREILDLVGWIERNDLASLDLDDVFRGDEPEDD